MLSYVLLLTILLGCTAYICLFPWDLDLESGTDYYYEEKIQSMKQPQHFPRKFRAFEKTDILLDITNFRYLSNVPNPDSWCTPPSNKTQTLVILVLSLRRNAANRELIRKTWGSLRRITRWSIKLVFVMGGKLGKSFKTDKMSDGNLQKEIQEKKDIIMGNFEEEYAPKKIHTHMMAYKWVLTFCSNVTYVLKTTDSTFIDTFQIAEIATYLPPTDTMICALRKPTIQYKSGSSGEIIVPQHCRPEGMLLSLDVLEQLYLKTNIFSKSLSYHKERNAGVRDSYKLLDDQIHVTGHVVQNLGIIVKNFEHKVLYQPDPAYEWARNGKKGRDQRLPWIFVVIPDGIDADARNGITKLWKKIMKVSSLVFEFELAPTVKVSDTIKGNFETAKRKLIL